MSVDAVIRETDIIKLAAAAGDNHLLKLGAITADRETVLVEVNLGIDTTHRNFNTEEIIVTVGAVTAEIKDRSKGVEVP